MLHITMAACYRQLEWVLCPCRADRQLHVHGARGHEQQELQREGVKQLRCGPAFLLELRCLVLLVCLLRMDAQALLWVTDARRRRVDTLKPCCTGGHLQLRRHPDGGVCQERHRRSTADRGRHGGVRDVRLEGVPRSSLLPVILPADQQISKSGAEKIIRVYGI